MTRIALFIFCLYLFSACDTTSPAPKVEKNSPGDPFAHSMTESQFFELEGKEDNVVEGENGTRIVLPIGCFVDGNGEVYEGEVKLELTEALNVSDMLFSNLTATSNGELLESGGMLYFNPTTLSGQQLTINPENPVYVEIPTPERRPDMAVYKGVRDENGNMNWIDPKPLENFLTPVSMDLLDFYPPFYEVAVEQNMPFRGHDVADKALKDSLYFGLSIEMGDFLFNHLYPDPDVPMNYTRDTLRRRTYANDDITSEGFFLDSARGEFLYDCGINPAIIKTIWSAEFEGTIIATKEFEIRLKTIFQACREDVLLLYINNLEKQLWEIDQMAYDLIPERHPCREKFKGFADQKLGRVQDGNKRAEMLRDFFNEKLKENKAQLEAARQKMIAEIKEKQKLADEKRKEYEALLWQREKYRMETYGFELTEAGWVNVDIGTRPKDWGWYRLEMAVKGGNSYDQIYTYVIFPSIRSIELLKSDDKVNFYVGEADEKSMYMPKEKIGVAVTVAYQGEALSFAIREFETLTDQLVELAPQAGSRPALEQALAPYDEYLEENRVLKDLEYQVFFHDENVRIEQLESDMEFMFLLWQACFPCCPFSDTMLFSTCVLWL